MSPSQKSSSTKNIIGSKAVSLSVIFLILFSITIKHDGSLKADEKHEPFFTVHLIVSTRNPMRVDYAKLIEAELPKIGINSELEVFSSAVPEYSIFDRYNISQPYEKGGWDILFIGLSLGSSTTHPGEDLFEIYHSSAIPSKGFNIMFWSSSQNDYMTYRADESDDLISVINSNLDLSQTKQTLIEWQKLWYDVMPHILIYNQYEVHAISKGLYGYDPVGFPLNSIEDVWLTSDYTGNTDQVVLVASTGGDTFNPMIATDIYDQYVNNPVFDGLVGYTPSYEATLPTVTDRATWMMDNYNTTEYLALYPRVAKGMGTYSSDGLSYAIDIRENVYFHDGHMVDAWDIAMAFQTHLIPDMGSIIYSDLLVPFGSDDKANKHGNFSFAVTDPDGDGFFEHIYFTLNSTFAPFKTDYLGMWIVPEHILGDPVNHGFDLTTGDFDPVNQWLVAPDDWQYHSTTTGRRTDPGGYAGPISCGSMIFKDIDSTNNTITLEKFEDIKWDNATGQWVSASGNSHWNIDNLDDMPDTAKIIVSSVDSGLVNMKTGEVNIMDPQFDLINHLERLLAEEVIQILFKPEPRWQGLFMNPKFEENGEYHLNKRGVRHAISHVVNREKIISDLLNGLALPTYTSLPCNSWGTIPKGQLIDFKRNLNASDGSNPLKSCTTAYDIYSIDLALDWLETEGYDVRPWRNKSIVIDVPIVVIFFSLVLMTGFGLAALFKRIRRLSK